MKKNIKKLISLFVIVCLMFSLTGCSLIPDFITEKVDAVKNIVTSMIKKDDSSDENSEDFAEEPDEESKEDNIEDSEQAANDEDTALADLSDEPAEQAPDEEAAPAPDPNLEKMLVVETMRHTSEDNGFPVDIVLPFVSYYGGGQGVADRINQTFNELMDSAIEVADEWSYEGGFYDLFPTDISFNGYFLTVTFDETIYGGGAHPMHSSFSNTYDLCSGRLFDMAELIAGFSDDQKASFTSLLETALMDYDSDLMSGAAYTAASITNYGGGSWSGSKDGLTLTLSPGDYAPYSSGYITATIPASDLADLMDPRYFAGIEVQEEGNIEYLSDPASSSLPYFGTKQNQALSIHGTVLDLKVFDGESVVLYTNYGHECTVPYPVSSDGDQLLPFEYYSNGQLVQNN